MAERKGPEENPDRMEKMEFYGEDMLPEGVGDDGDDDLPEAQPQAPADYGNAGSGAFDPAGEVPAKQKRPRGRPAVVVGDPSKTVPVKGIPKRMLTIAKQSFAGDVTQTDAFVAYLVCNCPEFAADRDLRKLGLTDRQKELVNACDSSEYKSMMQRILAMGKKLDKANREIEMLTSMLVLLMYDHTGNNSSNEKLTAGRVMDMDFMGYDGGRFLEFRDAMLATFDRFVRHANAKAGEHFT